MNSVNIADLLKIQEANKNSQLVIFAGAGISANSNVPTWSDLINSMKKELPKNIKSESDYLKVAQLYFNNRKKKEYLEKVKKELRHGYVTPNIIHDAILDLEPSYIITTNFDNLFEQAIQNRGLQYYFIKEDKDLPYMQIDRALIKMHGDLETGNIVLTEKDYYDYSKNFPLIETYVKAIFASKLILLVGYSFNDMDLKIILNSVQNILKEHLQPVYLLSTDQVDFITKEYYEQKGIRILELSEEFIENEINLLKIDTSNNLEDKKGVLLFKQLKLIKKFKVVNNNILEVIKNELTSTKEILPFLGEELKSFIPKEFFSTWNFYSDGLEIRSEYLKNLKGELATYSKRKKYIQENLSMIDFLRLTAYRNNIYELDEYKIISNGFKKRNKNELNKTDGISFLYYCDYESVEKIIENISHTPLSYSHSDLEYPFLLYKIGLEDDSKRVYESLKIKFLQHKKYELYFICILNLSVLNRPAIFSKTNRNSLRNSELLDILNRCPMDIRLKNIFQRIITSQIYLDPFYELDSWLSEVRKTKKIVQDGGSAVNNCINSIVYKAIRLSLFVEKNYILYSWDKYLKPFCNKVAEAIIISHTTGQNNDFPTTRITNLTPFYLLRLIKYTDFCNLKEIIAQNCDKRLILSKEGKNYIQSILVNINKYETKNKDEIYNIIGNIALIIGNSDYEDDKTLKESISIIYQIYLNKQFYKSITYSNKFYITVDLGNLIASLIIDVEFCTKELLSLINALIECPINHIPLKLVKVLSEKLYQKNENILIPTPIYNINISDSIEIYAKLFGILYPISEHIQQERILNTLFNYPLESHTLYILYKEYKLPIFDKKEFFFDFINSIKKHNDKTPFNISEMNFDSANKYNQELLLDISIEKFSEDMIALLNETIRDSKYLQFIANPLNCSFINEVPIDWYFSCNKENFMKLIQYKETHEKISEFIQHEKNDKQLNKYINCYK